MNRRSLEQTGFVKFPIQDARWKSTQEGGMFVRLVVMHPKKGWMQCAGGSVVVLKDECYHGDDNRKEPQFRPFPENASEITAYFEEENQARIVYDSYHFPNLDAQGLEKYMSVPYLCAMTLGSTGWSGFSDELGYWRCTYEDLTSEGKALYESLRKLYPDSKIHLQTWLDT
jgi:hypothetical protein